MSYSIRASIRALAAPEHRLSCSTWLWRRALRELGRRGEGTHEAGAFILGTTERGRRRARRFVYYDDVERDALASGIVVFSGAGYGPLWQLCGDTGLSVVADVHTHGAIARQSSTDRNNPMIATAGHIALVVPDLARHPVDAAQVGVYEYEGQHRWKEFTGRAAARFFYVGLWG
jgi:proteasome lid subunit RPN8/RPN11